MSSDVGDARMGRKDPATLSEHAQQVSLLALHCRNNISTVEEMQILQRAQNSNKVEEAMKSSSCQNDILMHVHLGLNHRT